MPVQAVRIEGLDVVLRTLKALPAAMVSKSGGPVLFALRRASYPLKQQIQINLQGIIDAPNIDGMPTKSIGLLKTNIVSKRGGKPKGQNGERVIVGVRKKAYPQSRGKATTTPQVARLLEYGDEKRRAHPFIRPAFDLKKNEVLKIFEREIGARLLALVKKVEKQQGGKP